MNELLPWMGVVLALAGFIATFSVMKFRIGLVESTRKEDKDDFNVRIESIQIQKGQRLKEIKEDYSDKVEILHNRIDTVRKEVRESNEKVEKKVEKLSEKVDENNKGLSEQIREGNASLLSHVAELFKNISK